MDTVILPMLPTDYPAVARIYQQGIESGHATFELKPPVNWEAWSKTKFAGCNLAAVQTEAINLHSDLGRSVIGWAAISPFSSRRVYAGVGEVSIYIAKEARGQGVGSQLLQAPIEVATRAGFWTLQAGIFPENEASVRLHCKHGFRIVGVREKLGRMELGPLAGQWRDVLLLERRNHE